MKFSLEDNFSSNAICYYTTPEPVPDRAQYEPDLVSYEIE